MSSLILPPLLMINFLALMRAMIAWCEYSHTEYIFGYCSKSKFYADVIMASLIVGTGIVCNSIALVRWLT